MTTINAGMVSELRKITGAGMMDCKKALEAANGDMELAIENMRKHGQAKAVKRADHTAAEGLIVIKTSADHKKAVMLEVNCETDFVARDANLQQFAETLAASALARKTNDVAALMALTDASGNTLEQTRQALIAKIGENIQVRRIAALESTHRIATYLHGSRIGVLVSLTSGSEELGKDIAMHIAASKPMVVSQQDVPAESVAKEKDIFMAQAHESGKPANIIEKMVEGRIKKFLDEVSLYGQPFVKNPDQTVADLLKQQKAQVTAFVRFEVGEGIEKKADNFVEEVMAQVRGN